MSGSTAFQRREVHYRGRVQGVGFRYRTFAIARRYDVTGFVRNLPDGRVQVVAEGSSRELDEFLSDVAEAMSGYIGDRPERTSAATGKFSGFVVRY